MTPMTFGQLLRHYRQRSGKTQEQLADAMDVDFTYVSKIEGDKAPPPARDKIAVAAVVLGLSPVERDGLFVAAEKLPADLEKWLLSRPEMLTLYRKLKDYPKKEQIELLNRMIADVE